MKYILLLFTVLSVLFTPISHAQDLPTDRDYLNRFQMCQVIPTGPWDAIYRMITPRWYEMMSEVKGGRVYVGDDVPNKPGFKFGRRCEPVPKQSPTPGCPCDLSYGNVHTILNVFPHTSWCFISNEKNGRGTRFKGIGTTMYQKGHQGSVAVMDIPRKSGKAFCALPVNYGGKKNIRGQQVQNCWGQLSQTIDQFIALHATTSCETPP